MRTSLKILTLLVALLGYLGCQAQEIPVHLEGRFAESNGSFNRTGWANLRNETKLWDSWHNDDANTGKLKLGPIQLGEYFSIYLAGSLGREGVVLAWENAATGQRYELAPRFGPDNRWVLFQWQVPAAWRGQAVYMIAEDNSSAPGMWMGVSRPLPNRMQAAPALSIVFWHTVIFIALLLPGAALVAWRANQSTLSTESRLAWALVASATTVYVLFFVYFAHPLAGKISAWSVLGLSLLVFLKYSYKNITGFWRQTLFPPLLLCFCTGLMYSCILLLYGGAEAAHVVSMNRYLYSMPPDTILPYWLSERLFEGTPIQPFFGDWLSSDRPPLQAAYHLLIYPLATRRLGYQLMSTILQTWVLLGIWMMLRRAKIPFRTTAWILFLCAFSGFFLFNSTFVWPKLLPAAFLMIAASSLFYAPVRTAFQSGSSAALAMLCHGGSIFGLAGIGLSSLLRPPPKRFSYWAKTALIGVIFLLPWTLYQKYYDPPGNRLLKWHLGGAVPVDSRPLFQTLHESYQAKTTAEIIHAKWANVKMLFYNFEAMADNWQAASLLQAKGDTTGAFVRWTYHLREACFFHFIHSPELGILGLVGICLLVFKRSGVQAEKSLLKLLCMILALSAAVWCLLMFDPGSTGNHQGSYFNNACLFIILGLGIASLPRIAQLAFAVIYVAWFIIVWAIAAPIAMNTPALLPSADPIVATVAWTSGIAVILTLVWLARTNENEEASAVEPLGEKPL